MAEDDEQKACVRFKKVLALPTICDMVRAKILSARGGPITSTPDVFWSCSGD